MKLYLGPAGCGGYNALQALTLVKANGLNAMEVCFVQKVYMDRAQAKDVGDLAKKLGIILSVHASYYVNLNSDEREKVIASRQRILDACEKAHFMGAKFVVFHPAFYGKRTVEATFQNVKKSIIKMRKVIQKEKWRIRLAPELMGKHSQFGSFEESVRLVKETKCSMCIDFAHLKARNNGTVDYEKVLRRVRSLSHVHCHFSGIEFSVKGEKKHLVTPIAEMKKFLRAIIITKPNNITIINESPNCMGDSVTMLNFIEKEIK